MAEMAKQKPRMIALYLCCAWNNKPTLHYEGHDVMRKCATFAYLRPNENIPTRDLALRDFCDFRYLCKFSQLND